MKKCWIIISLTILALTFSFADDGMWLPHQMKILNLKSAGLEMDPGMLYNQDGTGIMSAVVHLGGGSGEFVSNDGLILTNHHVAFGAIQRGSDADHDYITDGFTAWDHSEEIPAVGYFANVLLGYKDVSDIVLAKVKPGMNEEKREKRIEKIIEKLSEAEEAKAADLRVVIRAMYGGNKYFMFTFKHISDIRLVYAPPKSLGNFGGDVDNWMWPRHTCDFSFLRAYVSPDGEGTDYSEENVPYRPKAKLKISLDGLKEGDFTFVMGYPGRTYRNYMMKEVEAEVSRMEGSISQRIANIDFLEKAGQDNRGVQIKYASRIKSLNNYLKNYQGKLESFEKANILNIKKLWEQELLDWINADNERFNKYGDVVAAFNKAFELQAAFRAEASNYPNFGRASTMTGQALRIYRAVEQRAKKDIKRDDAYKDDNWAAFKRRFNRTERSYDFNTDRELLKWTLKRWIEASQPLDRLPTLVQAAIGRGEAAIDQLVDDIYDKTVLGSLEERLAMVELSPKELEAINDPLIYLVGELEKIADKVKKSDKRRNKNSKKLARERRAAKRQVLAALYEMHEGRFAPDANSTIRFTYGTVKRYHPQDAVTYLPFTTLKGVIEKETGSAPFIVPEKVKTLHAEKEYGRYKDLAANDIVTCFLNTTNVTGGSSGSPTLNAKGEQVGIIFDMTYESVIGDYHVIPEFQRTISVDIRYVLWVTEIFSGAGHLIKEIGI